MAKRRANGEGNIRKRKDGRWEGRYTAGYDSETRKRITKNVPGKTQAEVKEKLKRAVEDSKRIDDPKGQNLTAGQWATLWFENCAKPSIRESTAEHDRNFVENHIMPVIGKIKLRKLTTPDIQKFCSRTREGGRIQPCEDMAVSGLSSKTVRSLHAMFRQCLDQVVMGRLILYNPAADCKRLPKRKGETNMDEVKSIVTYRIGEYGRGIVKLAEAIGSRGIFRNRLSSLRGVQYLIIDQYYTGSGIERTDLVPGKGLLRPRLPGGGAAGISGTERNAGNPGIRASRIFYFRNLPPPSFPGPRGKRPGEDLCRRCRGRPRRS